MDTLTWLKNSTIGRALTYRGGELEENDPAFSAGRLPGDPYGDETELTPLREPQLEKVIDEICEALDRQQKD